MAGYTVNFNINAGKIGADTSVITADSAEFVTASFSFDASWSGLYKTAVFRFGEKVYHVVLENDACKFPQEVLLNGMCYVSVFGVLSSTRATTAEVGIEVEKSGFVKVEPAAQTPDPYNYFLQAATAQKQAAEAAAAKALESQNKAQLAATAATEQNSAAYQNAQSAAQSANFAEGYKALAQQSAQTAETAKSSASTAAEQARASAAAAQSSADQAATNAAAAESAKTACLALAPTEITTAELNVAQLPSSASGYYKAAQNLKLVREAGSTENYYIPQGTVFAVYKSYDSEIGGDYTYYEVQLLNSCLLGEVGETISPYSTGNRYFYARVSLMGSIEYTFASTLATKRETTQAIKGLEQKLNTAVLTGAQQFCGALTGLSNGEILCLNNISPVEHQIALTAGSKNLFDVNGATKYSGLSSFSKTESSITASQQDNSEWVSVNIPLTSNLIGKTVTVSAIAKTSGANEACIRVLWMDGATATGSNTSIISAQYSGETPTQLTCSGTITDCPKSGAKLCLLLYSHASGDLTSGSNYNATYSNIQIEFGETATAYTPYLASLAGVRVTRYGKNLFNPATAELTGAQKTANGVTFAAASGSVDVKLPAGTYSISFKRNKNGVLYLRNGKTESGYFSQIGAAETLATFNYTAETDGYLRISSFTDGLELANLQIERASAATAYEPFTAKVYTADQNGSFAGVTSLYPVTTLLPGSTGVSLTAKYNKDINKAFAALQQAIISLGGNF